MSEQLLAATPAPGGLPAPERRGVLGRMEDGLISLWSSPTWFAPAAIALCIAGAFTYVLANNPTDGKADPLGACVFKATTGYDCPGCGGTRMVWYLLHGNFIQAGRHHLVVALAIPVLLYAYVAWALNRFSTKPRLPLLRLPSWVFIAFASIFVLYAVLRNIPTEPFSWFFV